MKFAICNELFEGWAFDRVCRFVRATGYDGLEVAPFTLADRITDVSAGQRAELRRQAADAGVAIIGLHWLLAKTEGFQLTSPDAAVRQRTAAYLVALAEACRDLGGSIMVFGSPKQRSYPPLGGGHVSRGHAGRRRLWRHDLHGAADHGRDELHHDLRRG
jgi:sugar phosphate isomerase/epimerase